MLSNREIRKMAKEKLKGRIIPAFLELCVKIFKELPKSIPLFFMIQFYTYMWLIVLNIPLYLISIFRLLEQHNLTDVLEIIISDPIHWYRDQLDAIFFPNDLPTKSDWLRFFVLAFIVAVFVIAIFQIYSKALDIWVDTGCSIFEAMHASRIVTRGFRFKLWLLDISFFGWYFLGGITFFLVYWYALPLHSYSHDILYNELKSNAISNGRWQF